MAGTAESPSPGTTTAPTPTVSAFICYRREDSAGFARALKTVLAQRYGKDRIFMDLDNILPGQVWADVVDAAVSGCDALIALIGPQWLTVQNAAGTQRLADADDPVRLEIESALHENLKIIPVLLERASMPRREQLPESLVRLPGIEALAITDDWDAGVTKLVVTLDRMVEDKHGVARSTVRSDPPPHGSGAGPAPSTVDVDRPTERPKPRRNRLPAVIGAIVLAALIAGGVAIATRSNGHTTQPPPTTTGPGVTSDAATLAYVRNVASLLAQSGAQRTQVRDAISAKDAATLLILQQRRTDLAQTVQGWSVPDAAKATNHALLTALRDSAIADGKWASYASGDISFADVKAFEDTVVHRAKFAFDKLYDELLATVQGGPSPVPTNFLF